MKERISVVVPVYNVEQYLEKCVNSIINQTYKNLEIILVDDGATDKSGKLCDELAKLDNRIMVYHKKNGGLSDARNYGLDKSTGDYIWFIDSDDWIDYSAIKTIFSELNQNPNLDILEFNYLRNLQGDNHPDHYYSSIFTDLISGKEYIARYGYSICACDKVFSKKIIDHVNYKFPIGRYSEDNIFCLRMFLASDNVKKISNNLYYYRMREGSITTKKDESHLKKYFSDIKKNMEEMVILTNKEDGKLKKKIEEMCFFLACNILYSALVNGNNITLFKELCKELKTLGFYPILNYAYHNTSKRRIFRLVLNNYYIARIFIFM